MNDEDTWKFDLPSYISGSHIGLGGSEKKRSGQTPTASKGAAQPKYAADDDNWHETHDFVRKLNLDGPEPVAAWLDVNSEEQRPFVERSTFIVSDGDVAELTALGLLRGNGKEGLLTLTEAQKVCAIELTRVMAARSAKRAKLMASRNWAISELHEHREQQKEKQIRQAHAMRFMDEDSRQEMEQAQAWQQVQDLQEEQRIQTELAWVRNFGFLSFFS